ncbi:MAG TPA: DUF3866 family protein [Solirubrobacterales bacterium]|nr:DUF3866 family protein [Solirubrobacterales bacterium]
MSGRLELRSGVVVDEDPLTVEVGGARRPAWADTALLGAMREGDEVVVNVAALDLELGSGGFDVVHVNLTRGLRGGAGEGEHVMKLNYSSLQHAIVPVERTAREPGRGRAMPVLVLPLHGHLAPAAWAVAQTAPGLKVGYVQTAGGALPGSMSRDVAELRERGLICSHVTAAPAYGGEHEALSTAGALDAAAQKLGWEAAIVGPGPGIIGSETRLGHGGMAALDNAHAALALGLPTLLSPRLSGADPRERHRGVSHHTLTVMQMMLGAVAVTVPAGNPVVTAQLAEAAAWRHKLEEAPADLAGYAASGLPTRTMGRTLDEDPLFFAAPLAAGVALRREE